MQDSPIVLTTLAGLSTGVGGLLAVLCPPSERLLAASAGFAGALFYQERLRNRNLHFLCEPGIYEFTAG